MKPAKQKPKTLPPCEPWQTGDFSRSLEMKIILPYQFLLPCKLWDVKPIDIITDFLDNLSHASWKRQGRDAAKQKLVEYVLLSGYGNEYYNEQQMLRVLRTSMLWAFYFPIMPAIKYWTAMLPSGKTITTSGLTNGTTKQEEKNPKHFTQYW